MPDKYDLTIGIYGSAAGDAVQQGGVIFEEEKVGTGKLCQIFQGQQIHLLNVAY